jgi:hypothetical protein
VKSATNGIIAELFAPIRDVTSAKPQMQDGRNGEWLSFRFCNFGEQEPAV